VNENESWQSQSVKDKGKAIAKENPRFGEGNFLNVSSN